MVKEMKSIEFKTINDKEWETIAEHSLRGRALDTLTTELMEDINLQPLYTNESAIPVDVREKMQEIIQDAKFHPRWRIIQPVYAQDAKAFIDKTKQALKNGNEAIYYDGRNQIEWNDEDLKEFAKLVTQKYPVCVQNVDKNDSFLKLFHLIDPAERHKVRGPILQGAETIPTDYKNFRNTPISTVKIHHEGADIVTELAVSLSKASDIIAKKKLPLEKFTKHAIFQFAIGTNFFPEIAKLRAFRILWHTFVTAHGKENIKVPIYAETSLRNYSKIDPNVNMLRAGNEAFAAVLGGADMVTVYPHSILTKITDTAERYARNVQIILKEEMEIDFVKDTASGSYYIDTLTKNFVDKAWGLFLEIEDSGGYEAYKSTGKLTQRINDKYDTQLKQLASQEKILVGTNQYADPSEKTDLSDGIVQFNKRLSIKYEKFWHHFNASSFRVVLLLFGSLREAKPRADFIVGFLASAGIKVEWSPVFTSDEDTTAWIKENPFDYGIICTPLGETEKYIETLNKDVTEDLWLDLAGDEVDAAKEKWQQYGISENIVKGMDQLEKFAAIKSRWEAMNNE